MTAQQAADIEKNVGLIVDQCHDGLNLYGFSTDGVSVLAVALDFSKAAHVEAIETLQFYKPNNEQVELLRALYQAQDDDGKKIMLETCLKAFVSPKCCAQIFTFLARYQKYPVQVRQYLEDTGFFSQQFRTLVDGLYKFMSDEGTHTLGATRDVARIARNIAVEIGLLITKRLQQPKVTTTKSSTGF